MKKRVYGLWKIILLQDIRISLSFCNVLLIIQIIMHIMFFLSFRVILPINFFLLHLIWHLLTLHVHKVHRYQDRYLIKCQMIYRISSFTMWYCNKLQDMHFILYSEYLVLYKLGVANLSVIIIIHYLFFLCTMQKYVSRACLTLPNHYKMPPHSTKRKREDDCIM